MARKDVFKGTLESLFAPAPSARAHSTKSILQSAALDAVEAGLARTLQLAEIDPNNVEASEFDDRMPDTGGGLDDLVVSIQENGQQIPILVQRTTMGKYRVIYGRRRLAAARQLGLKVKALITELDDNQRIIAQGVENTVRRDLSFIEKAMFAHRLRAGDVDDATIRAALNIDVGLQKATTVSTMKMVIDVLGEDLVNAIGRSPGIGRPRWRAMAELYKSKKDGLSHADLVSFVVESKNSDDEDHRFKAVFAQLQSIGTQQRLSKQEIVRRGDRTLAQVRRAPGSLTLNFRNKDNPEFLAWVSSHAQNIICDMHDRWMEEAGNIKEAQQD